MRYKRDCQRMMPIFWREKRRGRKEYYNSNSFFAEHTYYTIILNRKYCTGIITLRKMGIIKHIKSFFKHNRVFGKSSAVLQEMIRDPKKEEKSIYISL